MPKKLRYGDFVSHINRRQRSVSFNRLTPPLRSGPDGRPLPWTPSRLALRPVDVWRLLAPYVSVRVREQLRAVVPLAVYLAVFQIVLLQADIADAGIIAGGFLAVVVGLTLFMEGLKVGLMPFGEAIGDALPKRVRLPTVMAVAFLLGVGVTLAEPAIGALKAAGSIVDPVRAPYLHALLNGHSGALVLVVGAGVGFAALLGTLRLIYGWSLKPLIYAVLGPALALTLYCAADPRLVPVLALAWDCGAVTTGPVTVPLVLALGVGVAAAAGKGDASASGFGIVTLASLLPVLGVELLGLWLVLSGEVPAAAGAASVAVQTWLDATPWAEILGGLRAVLPLVLFLHLVMAYLLRERLREPGMVVYGIVLSLLGMIVFNLGLTYGLSRLGGQAGALIPAAFTQLPAVSGSPLYLFWVGIGVALAFAWLLGFGATLAEPALNALGITVENLTQGAFRKQTLMYAVSIGVGSGIALGVLKILFSLPLVWLLLPGYGLALVLTWLSSEEYVNIAWDSAGVTTGPVTVPLVLAMGLGIGGAVNAVEGFGILAMASIGPIVSVLAAGLLVRWKVRRSHRRTAGGEPEPAIASVAGV